MPPSNLAPSRHRSLLHLVSRLPLRVIILALACLVRIHIPARAFCTKAALCPPQVAKWLSQRSQRLTGCAVLRSNPSLKVLDPRVASRLCAVRERAMSSSSSSLGGEGGYGGEEVVGVLAHAEDSYDGIIVDESGLPEDPSVFKALLHDSMQQWRHRGKRGVWLKVPLKHAALVPVAADAGFIYHHAAPGHVMMTHWLCESAPSSLPPGPSHQVGVGAIVLDGRGNILAVQERTGPLRGSGVWKMPTGLLDSAEDIGVGACREVLEETGVVSEFLAVLAFRHAHSFAFNNSDLFFVAQLRPLSLELCACEREIEAVAWVPIHTFFNQPRFLSSPLYRHMYTLLSSHCNSPNSTSDSDSDSPIAGPSPSLLHPLVATSLELGFKKGQGTVYHAPTQPPHTDTDNTDA